jgi:hypothetical protein
MLVQQVWAGGAGAACGVRVGWVCGAGAGFEGGFRQGGPTAQQELPEIRKALNRLNPPQNRPKTAKNLLPAPPLHNGPPAERLLEARVKLHRGSHLAALRAAGPEQRHGGGGLGGAFVRHFGGLFWGSWDVEAATLLRRWTFDGCQQRRGEAAARERGKPRWPAAPLCFSVTTPTKTPRNPPPWHPPRAVP